MENVNKKEIIESLVASGMSIEDAEKAYQEAFAPSESGLRLPYGLIKVNNDAAVAPVGTFVANPIKNQDTGDVEGYETVYDFKDIEVLVLERRAMYSKYDGTTGRTTVKTPLLSTFTKASNYIDSFSGMDIATLREQDEDIKYQQLVLLGVRSKGSDDPFEFYCMFVKSSILFGFNKLLDTVQGAQYPLLHIITKQSKKGAVRYTEVDLDKSAAIQLPNAEVLKNVMPFLDAKTKYNEYIKSFNAQLTPETTTDSSEATESAERSQGLPE